MLTVSTMTRKIMRILQGNSRGATALSNSHTDPFLYKKSRKHHTIWWETS